MIIKHQLAWACFLTTLLLCVGPSKAGEFDGWCFPGDGCTGDEPVSDDTFQTCEANCKMTNPTHVNNMDALLYDVVCTSDNSGPESERMFFMRYVSGGDTHVLVAHKFGSTELVRCI